MQMFCVLYCVCCILLVEFMQNAPRLHARSRISYFYVRIKVFPMTMSSLHNYAAHAVRPRTVMCSHGMCSSYLAVLWVPWYVASPGRLVTVEFIDVNSLRGPPRLSLEDSRDICISYNCCSPSSSFFSVAKLYCVLYRNHYRMELNSANLCETHDGSSCYQSCIQDMLVHHLWYGR